MSRPKGSGHLGSVRSLRLPRDLDQWFEQRLRDEASRSASEILLEAIHGGLRLQPGYMRRQRIALATFARARDRAAYESYVRALADSFGIGYVKHVEAWLAAEGILPPSRDTAIETSHAPTSEPTMA
jgi:hypothetical protein